MGNARTGGALLEPMGTDWDFYIFAEVIMISQEVVGIAKNFLDLLGFIGT